MILTEANPSGIFFPILPQELTLDSPEKQAFQSWQRPPIPIEMSVYFFNVTNPDEVGAGKPYRLVEMGTSWWSPPFSNRPATCRRLPTSPTGQTRIDQTLFLPTGPYTFRETRTKEDVRIDHENGTVSYVERKSYEFLPHRSAGPLDEVVTHLNVPLVVSTPGWTTRIETFETPSRSSAR